MWVRTEYLSENRLRIYVSNQENLIMLDEEKGNKIIYEKKELQITNRISFEVLLSLSSRFIE